MAKHLAEDTTLLTLGETADVLGISYPTLRKYVGELNPVKVGKRNLFYKKDIPVLQAFFKEVCPADSPIQKAWASRRKGNTAQREKNEVLDAYVASLKPEATRGDKARATRLVNALCEARANEGKNPKMVLAGIKAQASRILAKAKA